MDWQKVESSNIAEVGYSKGTKTLGIKFHNGAFWGYSPVEALEFKELISAQSVGKHFNEHIKNNPNIKAEKW